MSRSFIIFSATCAVLMGAIVYVARDFEPLKLEDEVGQSPSENVDDGTWNIPADLDDIDWPISAHEVDGSKTWPYIPMPALPGVSGYEVEAYDLVDGYPSNAFILASETRDSSWAGPIESRIYSEISRSRRTLVTFYVECRATACGVLYVFPAGSRGGTLGRIDDDFAVELGFRGAEVIRNSSAQGPYTAIYLSNRVPAHVRREAQQ